MSVFQKILRAGEGRTLKRLHERVHEINALEDEIAALSDDALRAKTEEFRERFDQGEDLDDLLPEAFACVREAAKRTLGMRHFDVQLIGGMVLHEGRIAEMKTGEGKTLVATLPLFLNALAGVNVQLVTVNDYLAKRDAEWMGPVYEALGMSVGIIQSEMPDDYEQTNRRAAYACDITYGTNSEFGFDYLRDNMAVELTQTVQRGHWYAIVDEVDSILIDEARTPLIISGQPEQAADTYYSFASAVAALELGTDYEVDEKFHTAAPTEDGVTKVERAIGVENLYAPENGQLVNHLIQAIKAKELYKRDDEYVIMDGEVKIVDEFTGRIMEGRRWSEGLHQAVEAKEGVRIQEENVTVATVTIQNYFRMYEKLAGMTGTALTEANEFHEIYGLEVVPIPTHRPMVRDDRNDQIYRTKEEKFSAVVDDIVERHAIGQPVLVGTISVEVSEHLSHLLERRGVPHEVLNAKNHEREALIIQNAGERGAVTIATNMAGRGVDIKLADGVSDIGGLYVLGTERHESRRIDNQLRGRSGRQGDPGESRFYLSAQDEVIRLFAGERIYKILDSRFGPPDGEPIEAKMLTNKIEGAQKKVEEFHFVNRKNVVKYDDVMNEQRKQVYATRRGILEGGDLREILVDGSEEQPGWIEQVIEAAVAAHTEARVRRGLGLGRHVGRPALALSDAPRAQRDRSREDHARGAARPDLRRRRRLLRGARDRVGPRAGAERRALHHAPGARHPLARASRQRRLPAPGDRTARLRPEGSAGRVQARGRDDVRRDGHAREAGGRPLPHARRGAGGGEPAARPAPAPGELRLPPCRRRHARGARRRRRRGRLRRRARAERLPRRRAAPARPRADGRPQRPVLVRLRQEVQAVPWRIASRAPSRGRSTTCARRSRS